MTNIPALHGFIRSFSFISSPPADATREELAHHVVRLRPLVESGALEHMGDGAHLLLKDCERRLEELRPTMADLIEAHRSAEDAYGDTIFGTAEADNLFDKMTVARAELLARLPANEDEAKMKRRYIEGTDAFERDNFNAPEFADLVARLCEVRHGA